ncbi:MAG TPA: PBSX family phage terminase large subunit [Rhodothermales bacterium]
MTRAQAKIRTRRDLRIAAKVMPLAGAVQLPAYAQHLWQRHRYKVIWGGRGGTRSWTVARTLLLMAAFAPIRILCAREIQSSIKDSVHQLLRDQIELMRLTGFIVTDREIRHVNGSLFIFKGIRHNITAIKSLEAVDICWVEEAERITKESWSILIPTIRKPGSEIWVTFNPDQEDDATYKRFIAHPPKDCWAVKVGWQDNPWLSDELREEKDYMYATDPEGADWVWGGNTRRISEAQILRGKYVVQEFVVPYTEDADGQRIPAWDGPYQGQDFGFGTDPAAAVRLWVHDEVLYVEYEGWKLHLEIDETAAQWNHDLPDFHRYVTRADSARPDTISYLKRHGLPRIRPAKKHAGSVADGIAHLRSYRQIVIHPRCTHFIQECKLYSYKVDARSGDVLPIIIDKHNHLIDSARYALDPLIKRRRLVGLDFLDDLDTPTTCPECESMLPDDGECPHCGWTVPSDDPPERPSLEVIQARVHALTTIDKDDDLPALTTKPNGNGHTNGNGKGTTVNARYARLRGINDD